MEAPSGQGLLVAWNPTNFGAFTTREKQKEDRMGREQGKKRFLITGGQAAGSVKPPRALFAATRRKCLCWRREEGKAVQAIAKEIGTQGAGNWPGDVADFLAQVTQRG